MKSGPLEGLRKEIDYTDKKILTFLAKRAGIVEKIGQYKKSMGASSYNPKRWNLVLGTRIGWAKSLGLQEKFIKDIYTLIHKYSLKIQDNKK